MDEIKKLDDKVRILENKSKRIHSSSFGGSVEDVQDYVKAFFNVSQIVDENGEPMVVWRGRKDGGGVVKIGEDGAHFTTDKSYAEEFTERGGAAKKSGFDGVASWEFSDRDDPIFIAFEPNQIKSATENAGTYDGGNADIRFKTHFDGEAPTLSEAKRKIRDRILAKIQAKPGVKIIRESDAAIRKSAAKATGGKFKALGDGRLQLPPREYAVVRAAIAQKEYVFGNKKQYGYVFSSDNFYVYTKPGIHRHVVDFGLPIVGNEEIIDLLIQGIENGTLEDPISTREYIEGLGRGRRGSSNGGSVSAKKRIGDGGLSPVRNGQQSDKQTGDGENRGASPFLTGESSVGDVVSPTDLNLTPRYLRDERGVVYGYYDPNTNELHLNEDYADLDTPIHEWTHVWWAWLEKQDPRMVKRQSCRFVLTF